MYVMIISLIIEKLVIVDGHYVIHYITIFLMNDMKIFVFSVPRR